MSATKTQCYSLLFLPKNASKQVNLESGRNVLDTYVACANLLAKSVDYFGYDYTVLTNNADTLRERQQAIGADFPIKNIRFKTVVPKGIPFYEAHFKLDVFRFFASAEADAQMCLVDLDAVMVAQPRFEDIDWSDALLVYDITAMQIQSYGHKRLAQDIRSLTGVHLEDPRWFGGEFIAGTPAGFRKLNNLLAPVLHRYWDSISTFHHVGDEMVVSAALNIAMRDMAFSIVDVGTRAGTRPPSIGRWWSSRTRAPQLPFSDVARATILHLPSDKSFLSTVSQRGFNPKDFLKRYEQYLRWRLMKRRFYNFASLLRGNSRHFVGRIR